MITRDSTCEDKTSARTAKFLTSLFDNDCHVMSEQWNSCPHCLKLLSHGVSPVVKRMVQTLPKQSISCPSWSIMSVTWCQNSATLPNRITVGGLGDAFWGFFGHKMAKITPINLKIGLSINLDINDGQNKNQVHMY